MEKEVKTGSEERQQAEMRRTADRRFGGESAEDRERERKRELHILLISLTHSFSLTLLVIVTTTNEPVGAL